MEAKSPGVVRKPLGTKDKSVCVGERLELEREDGRIEYKDTGAGPRLLCSIGMDGAGGNCHPLVGCEAVAGVVDADVHDPREDEGEFEVVVVVGEE